MITKRIDMNNKIMHIMQIIIIAIFIISIVPKEFQNDTFFTIALGERTVNYGIEETDRLVWHENLNFIHLRWLFDVVVYTIFNHWSYAGIYFFVIVVAVLQGILYYYILSKLTKNKFFSFIITLINMFFLKNEFTGRAQIISFTLFLLEYYCINQLVETDKKRYFIILLFIPILLVNFHASVFPIYFVLYLPYIAQFVLSKIKLKQNNESKIIVGEIKFKKIVILLILMVLGIILGFCSPIGINAYKYMFKVMDGLSAKVIGELQPVDFLRDKYLVTLVIIAFSLISFTDVKVRLVDCLYILGFLFLALPTYRCIFFFYLIASICIYRILNDVLTKYKFDITVINPRLRIIMFYSIMLCILLFSTNNFLIHLKDDYIDTYLYPVSATEYIINNIDISKMKIYNHFDFGSYLELRKIPVFIDSRSEMYTKEFNENTSILSDSYNISLGIENYKDIFDKYEITHALLYNRELISIYIKDDPNWKLIYQDDIFGLYERIN